MAKLAEAIYVIHAFRKRSQKTNKHDIELARKRFKEIRGFYRKQFAHIGRFNQLAPVSDWDVLDKIADKRSVATGGRTAYRQRFSN